MIAANRLANHLLQRHPEARNVRTAKVLYGYV